MSTGDWEENYGAHLAQAVRDLEHRVLTLEQRTGPRWADRAFLSDYIQCGTCGVFCQAGSSCDRADCPHPLTAGLRFTEEDHEAS